MLISSNFQTQKWHEGENQLEPCFFSVALFCDILQSSVFIFQFTLVKQHCSVILTSELVLRIILASSLTFSPLLGCLQFEFNYFLPQPHEVIISTTETVRQKYFLDVFLSHETPLLFVGPTGTGKSAITNDHIVKLDRERYIVLFAPSLN